MPHKASFVFALIFITQLIFSCDVGDWCDCAPSQNLEIIYDDVEITAWNTAGFRSKIVKDTVFKEAFGLSVSVNFTTTAIAMTRKTPISFGFNSAMACSCAEDDYHYNDPISNLKILVKDTVANEGWDVTSNFSTYGYSNGDPISLEELFAQRADWHDGFQFDLTQTDSIPNSSFFTIEVYLESGKILTSATDRILFYE